MLLVHDEKTGNFSQPAFYSRGGVGVGFLAGGHAAKGMLLINTQKALDSMLSTEVKLSANASVASGPKGVGQGATVNADIVSYSKAKGAFASRALDGQVIDIREGLNAAYCGKPVSPVDILIKINVSNPDSAPLQAALESIATQGSKDLPSRWYHRLGAGHVPISSLFE